MTPRELRAVSLAELVTAWVDAFTGWDERPSARAHPAEHRRRGRALEHCAHEIERRGNPAKLALVPLLDHPRTLLAIQAAQLTLAVAPDDSERALIALGRRTDRWAWFAQHVLTAWREGAPRAQSFDPTFDLPDRERLHMSPAEELLLLDLLEGPRDLAAWPANEPNVEPCGHLGYPVRRLVGKGFVSVRREAADGSVIIEGSGREVADAMPGTRFALEREPGTRNEVSITEAGRHALQALRGRGLEPDRPAMDGRNGFEPNLSPNPGPGARKERSPR